MRNKRKHLIVGAVIIAFLVASLFISGFNLSEDLGYDSGEKSDLVLVIKVIDGDTIDLEGGVITRVRYLAVDAPELKQSFGWSAWQFNKKLVLRKEVRLEYDYDDAKVDEYGRLLAYVWIDDVLVNEKLVEEGYARVSYLPTKQKPKYLERLKKAEEKAKSLKKGLWERDN